MAEEKDSFVTLVNPEGVQEEVWDMPGHADRLLTLGWTYPTAKVMVNNIPIKGVKTITDKE